MREMLSNVNAPVMESVNENQITIPSGTTVKIAIHTRYGAASALFFIGGFLPALRGFLLRLRIVFRVGKLVIFLREGAVAVESGILALVHDVEAVRHNADADALPDFRAVGRLDEPLEALLKSTMTSYCMPLKVMLVTVPVSMPSFTGTISISSGRTTTSTGSSFAKPLCPCTGSGGRTFRPRSPHA